MAIFRLPDSQPSVLLLCDDPDNRSQLAFARCLSAANITFHILSEEFDNERFGELQDFVISEVTDAISRPHSLIDLSLMPLVDISPYILETLELYPSTVFVSSSPFYTTAQLSASLGFPNVARVNLLCGFFPAMRTVEFAPSVHLSLEQAQHLSNFFEQIGFSLAQIEDVCGFVAPRILAMLVNEGAFAVMENVSSAAEIDEAMRLGTNYPRGPLEWADDIGLDVMVRLLDSLYAEYRQERYRTCRLLRQYVAAGWYGKKTGKGFYAY